MSKPVCYANDSVAKAHVSRVQGEANQKFLESSAVQNTELLSGTNRAARERALAASTKIGKSGLLAVARQVTHNLFPPRNLGFRTNTNVYRLLSSERVTTEQVVGLVKLLEDPKKVTAFRNAAQQMFLGAQLFYFDYVPSQGAIMCLHPKKK